MSPIDQARARHHAYTLFGRLFLQPITADLLPYLHAIPDLAAALPDPFDPDQTAATHHTLFAFNLFPYASIFLDPSRLLGGPIASEHDSLYRQAGFTADAAVEPDHLGQCLLFLAHLSQLEADFLEAGQPADDPQNSQLSFLENHFLPWFVSCVIAIQRQNDRFYGRLTQLSLALAADHYITLKSTQLPITNYQSPITNQPINQSTTLPEIARFLVTPVLSGIYLGRSDITHLARRLNLPHGFGRRNQMLQTLLQSAAQYDSGSELLAALQELVGEWQEAYEQLALDYGETADFIAPWQSRANHSQQLLTQIKW